MPASSHHSALALLASLLVGSGCVFSPIGGTTNGGDTSPGAVGFGKPTLEITVGGAHFGPATPDVGAAASIVNTVDPSTSRITQSVFQLSAGTASVGDACTIGVQRLGDGLRPIGVASYLLTGGGGGVTPDGMVEPVVGEGVRIPQGDWNCYGSACSGGGFQIKVLDATHVEGFMSGTFDSTTGGASQAITCSFWVPIVAAP